MFITENELRRLQASSQIYLGLPLACIFVREFKRKDRFKKFDLDDFRNFFIRSMVDGEIEIMFPDYSFAFLKLSDKKCYVTHPQALFFMDIDIP